MTKRQLAAAHDANCARIIALLLAGASLVTHDDEPTAGTVCACGGTYYARGMCARCYKRAYDERTNHGRREAQCAN